MPMLWVRDNLPIIFRAVGLPRGLSPHPPSYPQRQENVSPTMKGAIWALNVSPSKQKRLRDPNTPSEG